MSLGQKIINYINQRQRADYDIGKSGSYQIIAIHWGELFALIALMLALASLIIAIITGQISILNR